MCACVCVCVCVCVYVCVSVYACGRLVPLPILEYGHTAILVLELCFISLGHLQLWVQIETNDAAINTANHTEGKIL